MSIKTNLPSSGKNQHRYQVHHKMANNDSDIAKTQLQSKLYHQGLQYCAYYHYTKDSPQESQIKKNNNPIFTPLYANSMKTSNQNRFSQEGKQNQSKNNLQLVSKQSLKQRMQKQSSRQEMEMVGGQWCGFPQQQTHKKMHYKQKSNRKDYYAMHLESFTKDNLKNSRPKPKRHQLQRNTCSLEKIIKETIVQNNQSAILIRQQQNQPKGTQIKTKLYLNQANYHIRDNEIENNDFFTRIKELKDKIMFLERKCHNLQKKESDISSYLSETSERYNELIQENAQVNTLLRQYKEQMYKFQIKQEEYISRLTYSQKEANAFSMLLEEKESQIRQIVNEYKDKVQLIEELNKIIQEQKERIQTTQECFHTYRNQFEAQMDKMKEKVEDYEARLQVEGFTLDFQEIKYIKDKLQQKQSDQQVKYQGIIDQQSKQISKIKDEKAKISQRLKQKSKNGINYEQIQQILTQYDADLTKRDDQIIDLKLKIRKYEQLIKAIEYKSSLPVLNTLEMLISNIYGLGLNQINYQLVYHNTNLINALRLAEFKIMQDQMLINSIYSALYREKHSTQSEINQLNTIIQEQQEKIYNLVKSNFVQRKKSRQKSSRRKYRNSTPSNNNASEQSKLSIIQAMYQTPKKNKKESDITLKTSKVRKVLTIESLPQGITYCAENNHENSLQKILTTMKFSGFVERLDFIKNLSQFVMNMLSNGKKRLRSLNPSQIMVDKIGSNFRFRFTYQHIQDESADEKYLIYKAPEVLLGFGQSEHSYVWTLGIFIDIIQHGKLFYKKISQIICFQSNYVCTKQDSSFKLLLQKMLNKNHKMRPKLREAIDFINLKQ